MRSQYIPDFLIFLITSDVGSVVSMHFIFYNFGTASKPESSTDNNDAKVECVCIDNTPWVESLI